MHGIFQKVENTQPSPWRKSELMLFNTFFFHIETNIEYLNYEEEMGLNTFIEKMPNSFSDGYFCWFSVNAMLMIERQLSEGELLGNELIWHCPSFDTEK